jgi:hypothetical protein
MHRLKICALLSLLLLCLGACQAAPPLPVCPQVPPRPQVQAPPPPLSFVKAWCARHPRMCDPTTGTLLQPTQ